MIAAVFRPSIWARPTGIVWWDDVDGTPRFDFSDSNDEILARDELAGATSRIQFESAVTRLAARTPFMVAWESADLVGTSPPEYLALMQRAK